MDDQVKNPFTQPGIYRRDTDEAGRYAKAEADQAYGQDKAMANEGAKGIKNEVANTKKSELDSNGFVGNKSVNYAKGQGPYGMYNNRDYNTTLKLARQADAYNAKPMGHARVSGWKQPAQDAGTGVDKPQLNTMESRAASQALQLDTNQKLLAQALQDAVNHKDLDAFKAAYSQMFQVNLSDYQARNMMAQMLANTRMSNFYAKDLQEHLPRFNNWNTAQQQLAIWNLMGLNAPFANTLSMALSGIPGYDLSQIYSFNRYKKYFDEFKNQGYDVFKADQMAERKLYAEQNDWNKANEAIVSKGAGTDKIKEKS